MSEWCKCPICSALESLFSSKVMKCITRAKKEILQALKAKIDAKLEQIEKLSKD